MRNRTVLAVAAILLLGFVIGALVAIGACARGGSESGHRVPGGGGAADDSAATTTVFLVRHAEPLYPPPAATPRDSPLGRTGRERAARLAAALRDAGVTAILSTDLDRTLQTAAPLAERLGIEIETYDHRALPELAARLRAAPGRTLVSGHSNTTPELVRLLGGEPGEPIDEMVEFDRLYVVTIAPGRPVTTVLLRYGEPPGSWPPADPAALAEP